MKKWLIILFFLPVIAFGQAIPELTNPEAPQVPDDKLHKAQFRFDGAWLPDMDPSEIGPSNFRTQRNLRPGHGGKHPEGVLGYDNINTTALSSYPLIGNGIQLRTDRGDVSSYVLVWTEDSGGTAKVYQNQTDIPDQGDFEATELHTDASGAGQGYFTNAPQGRVAYCNGVESYVWAGDDMRVGGFITMDDASYTNPIDFTTEVNNTLDTTGNTVSIGTQKFWIVFTTLPIKSVSYTLETPNVSASTTTVKVWTGASFDAVSSLSDGTASGGVSLAQDGEFTFDSTVSTAKPFHLEGLYMYAYLFEIDAGSAVISHVSVNAPWQPIVDIWDAVYRQPVAYQVYTTKFLDYILEVNTDSTTDYQLGAVLDALPTATGYIIVIFEERMAGIRNKMLAGLVNTNAAAISVSYWNGTTWTSVGASLRDETQDPSGDALGKTGLISWSPPAVGSEHPKSQFGVIGYAYKISYDANLSGAAGGDNDIVIDRVTGIPAQISIQSYKFPSIYKNRLLLCAYEVGNEGNRVDFSQGNAPDVFNGEDSSANGINSLYFEDVEPLTCGIQLYNRYGSNVFTTWVGFKKSSFYQLTGDYPGEPDDPRAFNIKPISKSIGCPAPLTLVSVEGYPVAQDVNRNVVIWLSHAGPMTFDGGTPKEILGVKKYFDPSESICVNFAAIDKARAWYDATYSEYNLCIPSGANQTTNNVWLVYDVQQKKWFEKATGIAPMPQSGWPVVDDDGNQYIYAGVDTGYVMRLEYGSSWNGTGITYELVTGDFWPTGNIWDITQIRDLKIIAERIEEEHTLEIRYYADTNEDEGIDTNWRDTTDVVWVDTSDVVWAAPTLLSTDLTFGTGLARLTRDTLSSDDLTAWCHGFGFRVTTDSTEKAFTPIGWGIRYYYIRDDE